MNKIPETFNCSSKYFAFVSYSLSYWKKNSSLDFVHRLLSRDRVSSGVVGLNDGMARCHAVWWEKLIVLKMYQYPVTVLASISEWLSETKL